MALVLLPCDLPTWPTVQRYLNQLKQVQSSCSLIEGMNKLHNLCSVGLDPDDDKPNPQRFNGLEYFVEKILTESERNRFFNTVLQCIVNYALKLKMLKPINGLHFSLQQQADQISFDRRFILSLLANSFFSTFPKRTMKSHPTLQDFNFGEFFSHLENVEQQIKLRCILQYFDHAASQEPQGYITIARQVIPKWSTQTLDDWLKCTNLLCPLVVRHEGLVEDAEEGIYQVCFSSQRIGGKAFLDGWNQEETIFFKNPELLIAMLYVESLEDNEALSAHNWINVGHISENKKFCPSDKLKTPVDSHLCFIDATNFSDNFNNQYQDKYLLRELTKTYLGFQQRKHITRLSPIGESCSSTPPERQFSDSESTEETKTPFQYEPSKHHIHGFSFTVKDNKNNSHEATQKLEHIPQKRPLIIGQSDSGSTCCLSANSQSTDSTRVKDPVEARECITVQKGIDNAQLNKKLSALVLPDFHKLKKHNLSESSDRNYLDVISAQSSFGVAEEEQWVMASEPPVSPSTSENRPLHFCAPGKNSSDLPLSSITASSLKSPSKESEISDDEDDYQSCVEDVNDDEVNNTRFPKTDLVSSTGRWLLAESLRGAMQNSSCQSDVEDSSYVLDIHIEGPDVRDREGICVRRAPSTGFLLDEDDHFPGDSLEAEQAWLKQFRNRSLSRSVSRRNSSRYSFSSDFSSDLEDIYEHFEEMMAAEPVSQDPAVAQYVGGLLKRTLSDSFTTASRKGAISNSCDGAMPRSLSLADHLTQERLALEKAKQQALSSVPIQKRAIETCQNNGTDESGNNRRLSGQLVSMVIEKSLAEVEEKVALSLPKEESESVQKHLSKLYSQISSWWNCNTTNDVEISDLKAGTRGIMSLKSNSPSPFVDNGLPDISSACLFNQLAESKICNKNLHEFYNINPEIKLVPTYSVKDNEQLNFSNTQAKMFSSNELTSCSELSPFTSQESCSNVKNITVGIQNNSLCPFRKWISASDSALLWVMNKDKNVDFQELRKWDAICDLQDKDPNSCLSKLSQSRPRSQSSDACFECLETTEIQSHYAVYTDLSEDDSDQFWIVLDDNSISGNDDNEQSLCDFGFEDTPRKRVRSFSGTRHPGPRNLRRSSSEGAFQRVNTSKFLEFNEDTEGSYQTATRSFGACLGPQYEIFPTLQVITERKEVDGVSPSPSDNVTPCEEFSTLPSLFSPPVSFLSNTKMGTDFKSNITKLLQDKTLPAKCHIEGSVTSSSRECNYHLEIPIDPDGYRPIATGNWGCGQLNGDPQLKAIIQWLAASRSGIPCLLYFTSSNQQIVKLDIVTRVLLDRQWTVGTLMKEVLNHCHCEDSSLTLFDRILPNDVH